VALRKPSDFFGNNSEDNNVPIIESDNSFRDELNKVENLSEQVIKLQQELSQKVIKSDLESLVLSQINTMRENFEYLQNDFRKSNKKDIVEFKDKVSELTEIVGNIVENELPKYKKQVTKNELNISEKLDTFKEDVKENITDIRYEVDTKVNSIAEAIDESIDRFNSQLQETSSEVKRTSETYNKLSKIVESKVSKGNDKLEEYSQVIQSLYEAFVELETSLQKESSAHLQVIEEKIDNYLQENHQELVTLREEVFTEIEQIPLGNLQENLERLEKKIDYIKETYSKIEPEVIVKEVIKEGLLNIPPNEKTSDPLSPLDQNFVTQQQLESHYKLFINRIQQQLSTLGGGGETQLKYLDDIVGIATNASAYDGKFLKYDHSIGKFVFATAGGGAGSQTLDDTLKLGNTSSLGMSVGVITATSFSGSGANLTGIVTSIVAGTGITISGSTGKVTVNTNTQYYRLESNVVGLATATSQKILGVGVSLNSNTVYEFEGAYIFTKNAGAGTHNFGFSFGGTATINNIAVTYNTDILTGAIPDFTSGGYIGVQTGTDNLDVILGIAGANRVIPALVKGSVSVNVGGSFIPQYKTTAATAGAYSTMAGSYFKISPISGAGSSTSIGNWS